MGDVRHSAIVVTSWKVQLIEAALVEALRLKLAVAGVVESKVNGYHTLLIGPDGSSVGWDDDAAGDLRRAEFIIWMDDQRDEDGGSALEWVEVEYGNDLKGVTGRGVKITRHAWQPFRKERRPPRRPPRDALA